MEARRTFRRASMALLAVAAVLGASGLLLLASREWQTYDFLSRVSPLGQNDAVEAQRRAAMYFGAAMFDVMLAVVLIGLAIGAWRREGRAWYLAISLISVFAVGLGWYTATSPLPVVRWLFPSWLPVALVAAGWLSGLTGSILGFLAAPSLPPVRPMVPPVPTRRA
ncbi:MAG TPA: hypothetical protein VFH98_10320 [Candidatus Limnocylindria bacterium]|nr:hypothetical protein [Candidatus Limnocylindria bacterium]